MRSVVTTRPEVFGSFRKLDADRSGWQRDFADRLLADERLRGRVLDIGCGPEGPAPEPFQAVLRRARQVDGIDPDPGVASNPFLTEHWVGLLEDRPEIPEGAYDGAISFLVAEHVGKPREFLRAVHRLLKPGGVFYIITPHAHHPFTLCVRTIELLGLKKRFASSSEQKVNDYPAYYRMNSRRAIEPLAREIGFSSAEFELYPCVHWDQYFPRALRVLPNLYDRMIGVRWAWQAQLLLVKLEKAG